MTTHKRKITVIGHKNPDTDSICSAIAYAWLKNHTDAPIYEAKSAGSINQGTAFALKYFGVPKPKICVDVYPRIRDVEFRKQPGIDPETTVLSAARTSYRNILKTVKGNLIVGDMDSCLTTGRICIGTSTMKIQSTIQPGDLVLTSDQFKLQKCAIAGEEAAELLEKAFQEPIRKGVVVLPGIVSRKKQFLPQLKAATR